MIDFSQALQAIDDTVSFFENEEEQIVADTLRTRIINRTLNGLDVNNSPFVPYVPRYKRYGRFNKGLQITPVDLWALGNPHMLESIMRMDNHTLFFPTEFVPIAKGLQAKRYFFGANDEDWQVVANNVATAYNNHRR